MIEVIATYHLTMKPITRASGRSSVAAAAYRSGERLVNERDGEVHDFTKRSGVAHSEIVLPTGSEAEWARDRSALWNAAERAERRKDSRVAREFEVSLPHELSAEQRLELAREFSQGLADRYGAAVDFAIHTPHPDSDERNHHAHILMTTRQVSEFGLGDKTRLEWENKKLAAEGLPTSHDQLRELRVVWEQIANEHLVRAGHELRIDHRSHAARGLSIEPTEHRGVTATRIERDGVSVSRAALDPAASRRNIDLILEKPEQVLTIITGEKSVFDRRDILRTLHRYIDEPEVFQSVSAKVFASPELVVLTPARLDPNGREVLALYSTRELIGIEREMAASAERLHRDSSFPVERRFVEAALMARPYLADEQRQAVEHVTGPERIAAVVGLAGVGKSTLLAAARAAWESAGYTVYGAALSGRAAAGLEESSGIASRTLASWERSAAAGYDSLGARDVLVIDEAGMVSSRQLARAIGDAERAGAKVVLVGDPEQLQPIQAGAAFRAVAERVGFVELGEIRRQTSEWQRAASVNLGRYRTAQGLAAYDANGAIRFESSTEQARAAIVRDATADMAARPGGSRLVLAHRRDDVRALNDEIRSVLQGRGELVGEQGFSTNDGERRFATGDRILFLENSRDLGVKNGLLGTVEKVAEGKISARLDSAKGEGRGRAVVVDTAGYSAIDHGYATTIHKSQGATVDRAFLLASGMMDRHLTYVGMTRHRELVQLYAGQNEFADMKALAARLGRANTKETTLDYDQAGYAERRGFDGRSDIVAPAAPTVAPVPQADIEAGVAKALAKFNLQQNIEQGIKQALEGFERRQAEQSRAEEQRERGSDLEKGPRNRGPEIEM